MGDVGASLRTMPGLVSLRPTAGAKSRFVWLPFAGGSAAAFHALSRELPAYVEPFAVEYPGRGRRRSEPLERDLRRLARDAAATLLPLTDRPLVLFGHSMGALVGFEVCRLLRMASVPAPACLIVSAHEPLHLPAKGKQRHLLPDAELAASLTELGGTPPELLQDPQLVELVLPVLRADFAACELHDLRATPRVDVPLVVYGGAADADVEVQALPLWAELTSQPVRVRLFEGGHFYLFDQRTEVLSAVREDIERALQSV